jgi:diaminohydroxyphosphoribosylaminopyrimidine deaminase/5-amino-6-(5-phosphoribosylamino)uracil reductase
MVVTLEPCDHDGTTPPCTDAIISSGIDRVVVGAVDPDPRVSGRGIARLRAAGVEVEVGVLANEVERADPAYFHHRRTGRARVTLKVASTLDGQVAALDGTSRWITSPESREDVHRLRAEHDAVLVGIGTVLADDPTLDVRTAGYDWPQPRPIVVARHRSLPSHSRIAGRDPIVLTDPDGVDPIAVLERLPHDGILGVMVEGGPTIARAFLDADAVDEIVVYLAGRIAGGVGLPAIAGDFSTLADNRPVTIDEVTRIGPDVRISARFTTQEDA